MSAHGAAAPSSARYRSHKAGEQLVSMVEEEGGRKAHVPSSAEVESAARRAAEVEAKHEIITLEGDKLKIHEENFSRFQRLTDENAQTLVVSMLGDTSAGKSHTIRSLMQEYEFRPYCQEAANQSRATTFNVNLFPCTSLAEGVVVNFVDYEGENGSDVPAMARGRLGGEEKVLGGSPDVKSVLASWSSKTRHAAVQNYFPRLAYTTSDVVVVVSREPFYNRRYLERCVEFAKRANAGVTNVERPVLILVGNKLPGEECETSIRGAGEQFFNAWGRDAKVLDAFFSTVMCIYVPHRDSMWRDKSGNVVDGSVLFDRQIGMLRRTLAVLARRKMSGEQSTENAWLSRQLTQQQGLWFSLLPRVVAEINGGRGVDVTRLIDAAWAHVVSQTSQHDEMEMDAFRSFVTFLRPPRALSEAAQDFARDFVLRFEQFRHISIHTATRLVACRLRALDRSLLVPKRVDVYALTTLTGTLRLLEAVAPCWALYPAAERGTSPADGKDSRPVRCLQEHRVHGPVHRTARPVCGGTGLWGMLPFLAHNDSWEGHFHAPPTASVDLRAWAKEARRLALLESETEFLRELVSFQRRHSTDRLGVGFCPLAHVGGEEDDEDEVARKEMEQEWLLPPPESPLSHSEHEALHFLPFVNCKKSMPYCVGCGVKAPLPRSKASRPSSSTPVETDSKEPLAPIAAFVQSVSSWISSSSTSATTTEKDIEEEEDFPDSTTSLATSFAEDEEERPGAHEFELVQEHILKETMIESEHTDHTDHTDHTGHTEHTSTKKHAEEEGTTRFNVWFGLCPRCWDAVYTQPIYAKAKERRGADDIAPEFE